MKFMKYYKRVLLKLPAQLLIIISIIALSCSAGYPDEAIDRAPKLTHGPLVSSVLSGSAKVWLRTNVEASVTVKYSTSPDLKDAQITSAIITKPYNDFTGTIELNHLVPYTTYYYSVLVEGVDVNLKPLPQFKTFPADSDAISFKFGVLTDVDSSKPAPAMVALAKESPSFVAILGDYDHRFKADKRGYLGKLRCLYNRLVGIESGTRGLSTMRKMNKEVREEAVMGPYLRDYIMRRFPIVHVWDDHDYCGNDSDKACNVKDEAIRCHDEYWPTYSRPNKENGLWHQFSYGSVADFFVLDLRSQRDVNADPDDINKSMLDGDNITNGQKEWLKNNLLTSNATWKFILSSVPWNPTIRKKDAWYGFQTEQRELIKFIDANKITGIVFISGDLHLGGAIDNGQYAHFPEMNVAHTNNSSKQTSCPSSGCGQWSEGWVPDGAGYGLVTATSTSVMLEVKDENGNRRYSLLVRR